MTVVRAAAVSLAFMYCVCAVGAAASDPVITIRGGTVSVPYPTARARVATGGPGVDVSGLFDESAFYAEGCHPCLGGSVISLRGSLSGTAAGPQYIIASNFTFVGEQLQVPPDGRADVTLTAPFIFEGHVTLAHVREPRPDEETFNATVVGSGTATVHLSSTLDSDSGQRLYFFRDLTYEFSPVPIQ